MSARIRASIVGGGAAAVGILKALEPYQDQVDVTLYDLPAGPRSDYITRKPESADDPVENLESNPEFIGYLRSNLGFKFPPPKSDFGISPSKLAVENWGDLVNSDSAGGLTRFWGASALPYPDSEFDRWPISAEVMRPHYEAIVESIPVSGEDDKLSELWGNGLTSRPPLKRAPLFADLLNHVDRLDSGSLSGYDLVGGGGRMAVETDESYPNYCRQTGSCMTGCPSHAVFKASSFVSAKHEMGLIRHLINGEVHSFNPEDRTLVVKSETGFSKSEPFDLIFLAAGCIASTSIVLRSLPIRSAIVQDNRIVTFPIAKLTPATARDEGVHHFSLTNLVVACIPRNGDREAIIQMYPFFDLLWRFFSPAWTWRSLATLGRFARAHGIIARLYLPPEHSQTYKLALDSNEEAILSLNEQPTRLSEVRHLWQDIRRGIAGNGFWVPRFPKMAHSTSSHYGGTLPLGGAYCDAQGQLVPGVFLCDSSAFPASSAFSPTLTIMAYAHRTVTMAVQQCTR
jgi:hypothetical protein